MSDIQVRVPRPEDLPLPVQKKEAVQASPLEKLSVQIQALVENG